MKKELDCRGLQCPMPVAKCRDLIKTQSPEEIVVMVDNQAALENVDRYLNNNGYRVNFSQADDNQWKIVATLAETASNDCENVQKGNSRTLVLITTETLGRGDDSLGSRLMETFLGCLGELGDSLWRIVLLNGGVKLAASGSALPQLQKLEASGVQVLVCGTCLGHYGLLEQKKVGETTNMMDIVTSMAMADKVIRP